MMALSADDVADLRRWFISGAIVVLAHGAIAATVVKWRDEIEPGEPAAAIVIEFAPVPAAPAQGQITPNTSNAVPTWKTQIVALLERNKRYPESAQSRRQEGVAQVFFSLDRQGRVIDSRVVRSSGASALDDEALALLRRAQPFPPPPPEF